MIVRFVMKQLSYFCRMSVQCARKGNPNPNSRLRYFYFLAKNLLLSFKLLCGSASCPCFIRLSRSTFRRVVFSEKCLHYRRTETRWWMVSISVVTADAVFHYHIEICTYYTSLETSTVSLKLHSLQTVSIHVTALFWKFNLWSSL